MKEIVWRITFISSKSLNRSFMLIYIIFEALFMYNCIWTPISSSLFPIGISNLYQKLPEITILIFFIFLSLIRKVSKTLEFLYGYSWESKFDKKFINDWQKIEIVKIEIFSDFFNSMISDSNLWLDNAKILIPFFFFLIVLIGKKYMNKTKTLILEKKKKKKIMILLKIANISLYSFFYYISYRCAWSPTSSAKP